MSIFRKCTKIVLKEAVSTYSNGDFLLKDGQTVNGIKHNDIAMGRVGDWINSDDGFVSESE
jgi:hypothetical protein